MVEDARFEDADERPLRLQAVDEDDLRVIAALVQDAVLPASEMTWQKGQRRFAMLINRFRWEDREAAEREGRKYERVRALLVVNDVFKVASSGFDRRDADLVLSLLDISFQPGAEPPTGRVILTLAGDGAIALDVECLDVSLVDVTRPYVAPSGAVPMHKLDD